MAFDWDDENIAHVGAHSIAQDEAEQVIINGAAILKVDDHGTEERIVVVGRTDAGRYLTVVFTERCGKLRIITAFEASPARRRHYLRGGR